MFGSMKFKICIAVCIIVTIAGLIIMATDVSPEGNGWIGFLMFVLGILFGQAFLFCELDYEWYCNHDDDDDDEAS